MEEDDLRREWARVQSMSPEEKAEYIVRAMEGSAQLIADLEGEILRLRQRLVRVEDLAAHDTSGCQTCHSIVQLILTGKA
jgi:hypothetical protein